MTGWTMIGEDCDAIGCEGLLPLDWRTKAKGLLAHDDRWVALESLRTAKVHHGYRCDAPPGEYYGSEWWVWTDKDPAKAEVLPGWVELDECHYCGGDCGGGHIVCLDIEPVDSGISDEDEWAAVASVCESAPPEVHLVTAGDGRPWMSRLIGPCTVVTL